jgi:hypothetical protein
MQTACMQAEDPVSQLEGGTKGVTTSYQLRIKDNGVITSSYGVFPSRWRTPRPPLDRAHRARRSLRYRLDSDVSISCDHNLRGAVVLRAGSPLTCPP